MRKFVSYVKNECVKTNRKFQISMFFVLFQLFAKKIVYNHHTKVIGCVTVHFRESVVQDLANHSTDKLLICPRKVCIYPGRGIPPYLSKRSHFRRNTPPPKKKLFYSKN